MIGPKEIAEKRGGEVAEKKLKSTGNCKGLLYWMCIKLSTMAKDTYLYPALTKS